MIGSSKKEQERSGPGKFKKFEKINRKKTDQPMMGTKARVFLAKARQPPSWTKK